MKSHVDNFFLFTYKKSAAWQQGLVLVVFLPSSAKPKLKLQLAS
jgi:hypothetical protein